MSQRVRERTPTGIKAFAMTIPFLGEMLAIASAFLYALGSVAINKNTENGGTDNGAYLSIVLTAVLSGLLWLLMGNPLPSPGPALWSGMAYFILAGLLANLFGRMMMFRAVEHVGAIEAGVLRRMIPVFAVIQALLFLGEKVTGPVATGFVLVFSSVVVIFGNSRRRGDLPAGAATAPQDLRKGRVLGLVSSASYGGAYVTRKIALLSLPDPLWGTFVGALAGAVSLSLAFSISSRRKVLHSRLFCRMEVWQLVAAVAISFGQILQFFALMHTTVTAVAIIGTIEMFISAWLSVVLLKSARRPGRGFVLASLLAVAGTVLIALG